MMTFQQTRLYLGSNLGVSDHGTCRGLKNDANDEEYAGIDKADVMNHDD